MTRRRLPKTPPPSIRLTILPDMLNSDGLPRAGLVLPLLPNATGRRQALRIFSSVGAALAAKAELEARR
jgi:hypothetical protein